jgi:hypothetical protein
MEHELELEMELEEIWKICTDYDMYEVSNLGI